MTRIPSAIRVAPGPGGSGSDEARDGIAVNRREDNGVEQVLVTFDGAGERWADAGREVRP